MLVLYTDHVTEYQKGTSPKGGRLKWRLDESTESYATSIVTIDEIMRGWMAALRRIHEPRRQVNAYAKLQQLFRFFATWTVMDWDDAAADTSWR
jgi:tRNA(fMet)-specific endonuclease VapC